MTIITATYRNATVNTRRTHQNAPGATKPVREVSTAIRPFSNRFTALDGTLPPVYLNTELRGRQL